MIEQVPVELIFEISNYVYEATVYPYFLLEITFCEFLIYTPKG